MSVIIPVCNVEKYVEKCIRSVLEQSYPTLEIIVIDDGSTDRSGEILDRLAAEDDRILLVHQENRGVASARNRGVDMASGEYLTFVDGDDYICRNYILRFVRQAKETGAEMLICGVDYVSEKGHRLKRIVPKRYIRFEHEEWPMRISAVWAHFYRTELWRRSGIKFEGGARGEDMPVSLYFAAMCPEISIVQKSGYFYVQHENSAMHRFRGLKEYDLPMRALENVLRQIRDEGVQNSTEFFEVFVLRILCTCLFDLSRGAEKEKRKRIFESAVRLVETYCPGYVHNSKARLFSDTDFPFIQKVAVSVLRILIMSDKALKCRKR